MAPPSPPAALPSNRRGLAGWLLELAASEGAPVDADRVLLPYTVTGLNVRLGREPRCGTLFRRIRDLHPIVCRSGGGLLLDRPALEREAAGVRTSQLRPTPPAPPRAAAECPQVAPGPAAEIGDALELARAACRLLDQALTLIAAQGPAVSTPVPAPAIAPRPTPPRPRDPADFAASPGERGREVVGSSEKTSPSLTVVPRTANPATPPAQLAVSSTEIGQLLAPLVEVCRRTGLVGVSDTPGLRRALAPFSAVQIRHAVALVCRLTKAGSINTSPVGWLVAKARDADPDYFPTAITAPPPPAASRTDDRSAPDPTLAAAEQAVATAEADELAALDDWIRAAPHHARIRHMIFDRPGMLQAARLEAWRALQEKAS